MSDLGKIIKTRKAVQHCGVPQCNSYATDDISMHRLPHKVKKCSKELAKWASVLRMGKKFPKHFVICSEHFEQKHILKAILSGRKMLTKKAFPCQMLPVSSVTTSNRPDPSRALRLKARLGRATALQNHNEATYCTNEVMTTSLIGNEEIAYASIGTQCTSLMEDKSVQANTIILFDIASLWNTDNKLFTMTGVPSLNVPTVMINMCATIRPIRPNETSVMDFKTRILLTMHKLKSNCSFAELSILFQITEKTAKRYFSDIIQLLAKGMQTLIYWQSREQNAKNLPKCFKDYPTVRTILDCTEFKTVKSKCLTCRTCTYSHYKGTHTLKVLIGVSPSGAVNFLSKVATGKSSDKALFNLSELLNKLEVDDAVMVDKGFLISDELAQAGIEMIRPDFLFDKFTKSQVERSTKIAFARVHVERRIARLKQMKVLSERICASVIPYIDDIMVVVSALSNLTAPILKDDKF